jgi:hypothetical protein
MGASVRPYRSNRWPDPSLATTARGFARSASTQLEVYFRSAEDVNLVGASRAVICRRSRRRLALGIRLSRAGSRNTATRGIRR